MEDETEVEMVRRHVRQGAERVTRQTELVAELQKGNAPVTLAAALLELFEDAQRQHVAHLIRLKALSQ